MTWIETYSGKRFDLLDPKTDQVDLADIAHALARINRFTGHTSECYSVGEHSLHVLRLVEREYPDDNLLLAHALLHDAAEAYVGDVSAPMKWAMRESEGDGRTWFDSIEIAVHETILAACGLPPPTYGQEKIIKQADLTMLMTERAAFMPNTGQHSWDGGWNAGRKLTTDPEVLEILQSKIRMGSVYAVTALFHESATNLIRAHGKFSAANSP
jgi:hypothetical protein